jgi:hypothetical protein
MVTVQAENTRSLLFLLYLTRQLNAESDRSERGVRHEMSSPSQTLEPCVRIPLEARVSVRFYSVCFPV